MENWATLRITRVVESEGASGRYVYFATEPRRSPERNDCYTPAFLRRNGNPSALPSRGLVIESQAIASSSILHGNEGAFQSRMEQVQLPIPAGLEKSGAPPVLRKRSIAHLQLIFISALRLDTMLKNGKWCHFPNDQSPVRCTVRVFFSRARRPVFPKDPVRLLGSPGDGRGDVGTGRPMVPVSR